MSKWVYHEYLLITVSVIVPKILRFRENETLRLSQEFSLRQRTPRQVFVPATLHERTGILNLPRKC
jgi:hypothetical protein